MSLTAVQDPPESESEDGPDSDQGEPNAAWPSSSFHFRSGTPRSRHSSPGHSPRPGTGHTRFGDADSQTTSFWGGLSVQRRSGTRKVERAWYSKKRVKGIVGVIGLLVLYFVMNWVMLLRLQDHRLHSKSWFYGKSSSSPAPISEKLKRYGKGKKPVKGYERMLALAAHALAEWFFDMDRAQLVLVALPILLFCRDIFNLFTPRPPKPTQYHYHQIVDPDEPDPDPQPEQQQILQEPLKFPVQQKSDGIGETGIGSTINIDFCTSCSYRGNAITMKNTSYPGITVILANHPASFSKRLLSKLVPVVQVGIIGTILGGEKIFQRLGMVPPPS